MIRSFVAGMITGGLIVAIFGETILAFIDSKTRAARLRAADTAGRVAEGLETTKRVLEQGLTGDDRQHSEEPRS